MSCRLLEQTERTIQKHRLISSDELTLVALSGGADSVALLLALKELGFKVEALHCNFHLRGEESDRDELFVRQLCEANGITLSVTHFHTTDYADNHKISIEMAARELRYNWFAEMLAEKGAGCIAVAHHKQDQAETLLLNLLRGTGMRGLAGMQYRNGNIIRPMLDCTKVQITDFLNHRHQSWVEDSTNQERDALRNRIRLDIIPRLLDINPQAVEHIAHTAEIIQESIPIYEKGLRNLAESNLAESNLMESNLAENCQGADNTNPSGNSERAFMVSTLTELHEALRHCHFTSTQEENIFTANNGAIIESATHRLLKNRRHFILQDKSCTTQLKDTEMNTINASELGKMKKGVSYFDSDKICHPVTIRPIMNGDRMKPFGMNGSRLVSDILTDLKMNKFDKERQQVAVDAKGNILCIVGVRSSNLCRITDSTKTILTISYVTQHS